MGSWIKFFKDRTSERGSDLDIEEGKASWTQGKLDNIISVQVFEKSLCGVLSIPDTKWHQYDRYMVSMGTVNPSIKQSFRSARIIQAKITSKHIGRSVMYLSSVGLLSAQLTNNQADNTILLEQKHIGLWITLYIIADGQAGVTFCERGAFHGDKQILR